MLFRIYLPLVYIILCLLSLYHTDAYNDTSEWVLKLKSLNPVGFVWGNCGSHADPFEAQYFNLAPDPLKIPGDITTGLTFTFSTPSPTDITILVVMEKYIDGFWIKVPCVNNIGSCTYQNFCTYWSEACSALFPQLGPGCHCPIPAATSFKIPDMTIEATQTLPSLAPGLYRAFIDLLSGSAGQLGCLGFQTSISS